MSQSRSLQNGNSMIYLTGFLRFGIGLCCDLIPLKTEWSSVS